MQKYNFFSDYILSLQENLFEIYAEQKNPQDKGF